MGGLGNDIDEDEDFGCVQFVGLIVVALVVEDDDDEIARLDRFELTHVAPVDVNG